MYKETYEPRIQEEKRLQQYEGLNRKMRCTKNMKIPIIAFLCALILLLTLYSPVVNHEYGWKYHHLGNDADNDGINDTLENTNNGLFYKFDILQVEDYTDLSMRGGTFDDRITDQQLSVDMEVNIGDASFPHIEMQYRTEVDDINQNPQPVFGTFRFLCTGHAEVTLQTDKPFPPDEVGQKEFFEEIVSWDDIYDILLDSINVELFDGNDNSIGYTVIEKDYHYLPQNSVKRYPQKYTFEKIWYFVGEYQVLNANNPHKIWLQLRNDQWVVKCNQIVADPDDDVTQAQIDQIKIDSDVCTILKRGIDKNDPDTDHDGLLDGEEVDQGTCPFKADVDNDGLTDQDEIQLNPPTDPNYRDSDFDGIRDPVELQKQNLPASRGSYFERIGSDPAPVKANDNPMQVISNNDMDPTAGTEPTIMDTDMDGLPDGCVDGWTYYFWEREWKRDGTLNGLHDKWEGEDLNLDGKRDVNVPEGSAFISETDPVDPDSDGDSMHDGWERWFSIDPLNAGGNDGSMGDVDGDSAGNDYVNPETYDPAIWNQNPDQLKNGYEFVLGTNPRKADTEEDGHSDFEECDHVVLRTNVQDGAITTDNYGNPGDWIWFRSDPNTYANGKSFKYIDESVEKVPNQLEALFGHQICDIDAQKELVYIHIFDEHSWIYMNHDNLYVCEAFYDDTDYQKKIRKYNFLLDNSAVPWYAKTESVSIFDLYMQVPMTNPLSDETDGIIYHDRVVHDSLFYDSISDDEELNWNTDYDQDGLVNARDIDSDADGIQDPLEGNDDIVWSDDLDGDGKENVFDEDSDGDGLLDFKEIRNGTLKKWQFEKDPSGHPTFLDPFHPDSDSDGLMDGGGDVSLCVSWMILTICTANPTEHDWPNSCYKYLKLLKDSGLYYEEEDDPAGDAATYGDPEDPDGEEKKYTFYTEICEGTYPDNPDSDDDYLWDGYDVENAKADGRSHKGERSVSPTKTLALNPDCDDDGLKDGIEVLGWKTRIYSVGGGYKIKRVNSNPWTSDTEPDGISDYNEYLFSLDPRKTDTDLDGLPDKREDWNRNGQLDTGEYMKTDPTDTDSDNDRLPDGWIDYNNNNSPDIGEYENVDCDNQVDVDETDAAIDETDPLDVDSDDDMLSDSIEHCSVVFRSLYRNLEKSSEPKNRILVDVGQSSLALYKYHSTVAVKSGDILSRISPIEIIDQSDTLQSYEIYYDDTMDEVYLELPNGQFAWYTAESKESSTIVPQFFSNHHVAGYTKRTVVHNISNATKDDTDDDGICDYDEVMIYADYGSRYLEYMDMESQWDEATNDDSYNAYDSDSDGDEIDDKDDLWKPYPKETSSVHLPGADPDGDGIPNVLDYDSDGDTPSGNDLVSDKDDGNPWEDGNYHDEDGDGLSDNSEIAPGGTVPTEVRLKSDPKLSDSDQDGIEDGAELDWGKDIDGDGFINARDIDSDNDGLVDGKNIKVKAEYYYQQSDGALRGQIKTLEVYVNDVKKYQYTQGSETLDYFIYTLFKDGIDDDGDGTVEFEPLYKEIERLLLYPRLRDPSYVLTHPEFIEDSSKRVDLCFEVVKDERVYSDDESNPVDVANFDSISNIDDRKEAMGKYIEISSRVNLRNDKWYFKYWEVEFEGEDQDCDGKCDSGETSPVRIDTDSDDLIDGRSIVIRKDDFTESKNPLLLNLHHFVRHYEYNSVDKVAFVFFGEDSNCNGQIDSVVEAGKTIYLETNPRSKDSDGDLLLDNSETFNCWFYEILSHPDDHYKKGKWTFDHGRWGMIRESNHGDDFIAFRVMIKERADYLISFKTNTRMSVDPSDTETNPKTKINSFLKKESTGNKAEWVIDANYQGKGYFDYYYYYKDNLYRRPDWLTDNVQLRLEIYKGYYEQHISGNFYYYNHNVFFEDVTPGVYQFWITNEGSYPVEVSDVEVSKRGLDPANADADGDTIYDTDELRARYGRVTSPVLIDSDWDTIDDWTEILCNYNPMNRDTDFDGIYDGIDVMPKGTLSLDWSTMKCPGYDFFDKDYFHLLYLDGLTYDTCINGNKKFNAYNSPHWEREELYNEYIRDVWGPSYRLSEMQGYHGYETEFFETVEHLEYFDGKIQYDIDHDKDRVRILNYDFVEDQYPRDMNQYYYHTQFQTLIDEGTVNQYNFFVSIHNTVDKTDYRENNPGSSCDYTFGFGYKMWSQYFEPRPSTENEFNFLLSPVEYMGHAEAVRISDHKNELKGDYNVYQISIEVPVEHARSKPYNDPEYGKSHRDGHVAFDLSPVWIKYEQVGDVCQRSIIPAQPADFRLGGFTWTEPQYGYAMIVDHNNQDSIDEFRSALHNEVASQCSDNWTLLQSGYIDVPGTTKSIGVINLLHDDGGVVKEDFGEKDSSEDDSGNDNDNYGIAEHSWENDPNAKEVVAFCVINTTVENAEGYMNDFAADPAYTWSGKWSSIIDDVDPLPIQQRPNFDDGIQKSDLDRDPEGTQYDYGAQAILSLCMNHLESAQNAIAKLQYDIDNPEDLLYNFLTDVSDFDMDEIRSSVNGFFEDTAKSIDDFEPFANEMPVDTNSISNKYFDSKLPDGDINDYIDGQMGDKIDAFSTKVKGWVKDKFVNTIQENTKDIQKQVTNVLDDVQGEVRKYTEKITNSQHYKDFKKYSTQVLETASKAVDTGVVGLEIVGGCVDGYSAIVAFKEGDVESGLMYTATTAQDVVDTYSDLQELRGITEQTKAGAKLAFVVTVITSVVTAAIAVYHLCEASNVLEFDLALEELAVAIIDGLVACLYPVPIIGWVLAAIDGLCRLISGILSYFGLCSGSMSLGECLVKLAEWIAGVTPAEERQHALESANQALLDKYNEYAEQAQLENDPTVHWHYMYAEPPEC